MAALRSLDIEVDGCEQWVDRLEARGVTSRWAREALWYWQVRLRQARHKQSLAATESPVCAAPGSPSVVPEPALTGGDAGVGNEPDNSGAALQPSLFEDAA